MQQAPQQVWSPEQLNNLVAPIALYPDPLLGQLLVASTYPLEVVEANQWLQRNKNLSGQELMDAAKQQSWDPSVQALVAVPDALAKLNQDIRWTTDLGNAFLAQQADVMNAVQQMRARAQANGNLSSTPQQTVTTEAQGGQQVIVIQPANPQVIYVPYYDPVYVWGPPVYGYYPPLYYSGFGFGFGRGFNLSFYFDDWGGWGGWGWGPSWFGRSVFVNNSFFPRYGFHRGYGGGFGGRTIWAHDPGHRLGIPYGNHQVAARFEGASMASRNSFRAGAGSRVAAAPYANRSAGRFAGRTGEQGYRNTAATEVSGAAAVPGGSASRSALPEPAATEVSGAAAVPGGSASKSALPEPAATEVSGAAAVPGGSASRSALSEPAATEVSGAAAVPGGSASKSALSEPAQQRYQAPQQYRAAAPQSQRFQSQPQQRYQAPQQYRSAPQMSASRSSSGGSSGGRPSPNGGGGPVADSPGAVLNDVFGS